MMKRMLVTATVVMAMLSVASIQAQAQRGGGERAVMAAEHAYTDALLKSDIAAFDKLFAPTYIVTKNTGQTLTKAQHLAYIKTGVSKFTKADIGDVRVKINGSMAVVTGQLNFAGSDESGNVSGRSRYTHVYMKQNGRWRMVSNHFHKIREGEV